MEEKKGTKTHRLLITFLIIIVLIILIITSFYIYLQISTTSLPDSKEVEITELKSQIQKLETELANHLLVKQQYHFQKLWICYIQKPVHK